MQTSSKGDKSNREFVKSLAEWVQKMPEIKLQRPSRRSQNREFQLRDRDEVLAKFRRSCTLNNM